MTNIRAIPVSDLNGVFLYYKYEVSGDNTNDDFSTYYSRSAGVTIDLSTTPGDDTFHGGDGNDTIDGGAGSDLLYGDNGNDVFVQKDFAGNDTIVGGAGMDAADYSQAHAAGSSITVDITSGTVLKYQDGVMLGTDDLSGIERIVGTGFDDVMHGGEMPNQVTPISSVTLDGGAGVDTLSYKDGLASFGRVNLNLANGTAIKYFGAWEFGRDKVSNFEHAIGSKQSDTLTGSSHDDFLDGDGGNDVVKAGAGNDHLRGGSGNDALSGEDGNDIFVQDSMTGSDTLDGGRGFDTVTFSQSGDVGLKLTVDLATGFAYRVADNGLASIDTLRNIEAVTGSNQNDTLKGGANADVLSGIGGDDSLNGNAGNDTLDGGAGNDTLDGGAGNDQIQGGDGNDYIVGGNDAIDGGVGNDIVDFSHSPEGVYIFGLINVETVIGSQHDDTVYENFIYTNTNTAFYGNDGDDYYSSWDGNDTFNGGSGDDSFSDGEGNCVFVQEDDVGRDYFSGKYGYDTFDYSNMQGGIIVDVVNQFSYTYKNGRELPEGLYVPLWDQAYLVESYIGTRYNDDFSNFTQFARNFSAGDGQDTLTGGGQGDILTGGAGSDLVFAGAGDDRIVQDVLSGDDTIDGGEGNDTLDYSDGMVPGASISVDLAAGTVTKFFNDVVAGIDTISHVENIIGTRHDKTLTGTADADALQGGAGRDTINGAGGNDTLRGAAGNDLLSGDDGDDAIIQDVFAGNDSINGGAGSDTLDYSHSTSAGIRVVVDFVNGTAIKFQGAVVIGVDVFQNIEHVINQDGIDVASTSSSAGDEAAQSMVTLIADAPLQPLI